MKAQAPKTQSETVTLTGFLGRKPEIKTTKTITHEIPERRRSDETHEYILPAGSYEIHGREYLAASLATHRRENGQWRTEWHRLIVWNVDRDLGRRRPATICRKGSKVEITGRRTSFETEDGQTIEQIEVEEWKIVDLRPPEFHGPGVEDAKPVPPAAKPKAEKANKPTPKPYASTTLKPKAPPAGVFAEGLYLTVRRIDQAWHVYADDREHGFTHRHGFTNRKKAWRLIERIRESLETGRDLNLAHWEVEPRAIAA